ETQDGGHDRIQPLRLARIARVGPAAIAESMIATARVKQPVIGIAGLGRWIELDCTHRMRQVGDNMRLAKQLAPCTLKCVGGGIGRVPFSNDVVIGDVLQAVADRNEVGFLWIAGPALSVHSIEEAVLRKFGMKDKSDETAFEAVVNAVGKSFGDIGVYMGAGVLINQIKKAAGIICGAAAVKKFAHLACPPPSPPR